MGSKIGCKFFCKTCGVQMGNKANPNLSEEDIAALPEAKRGVSSSRFLLFYRPPLPRFKLQLGRPKETLPRLNIMLGSYPLWEILTPGCSQWFQRMTQVSPISLRTLNDFDASTLKSKKVEMYNVIQPMYVNP